MGWLDGAIVAPEHAKISIFTETAMRGAQLQTRVNDACNQAKWMRNAAGVMWLLLLLRTLYVPSAGWGYIGVFFAIPVWLIMWQVRFRNLETPDPDYKTAKRDWLITLIIWLPASVLEVISILVPTLMDSKITLG